jgi:hypothetical protein
MKSPVIRRLSLRISWSTISRRRGPTTTDAESLASRTDESSAFYR